MIQNKLINYLLNCFWLAILPVLISLYLTKYLPEAFQTKIFWNNIPSIIKFFENIFRLVVIILPLFFPINIISKRQKTGVLIYLTGIALYLMSYAGLIYFPDSSWSKLLLGFTAPATTPAIWLAGIGLIMEETFFKMEYRKWIYMVLIGLFCGFHFMHTCIIYYRY